MEVARAHASYKKLQNDETFMAVDTNEEDWYRMHDIVFTNGQVIFLH